MPVFTRIITYLGSGDPNLNHSKPSVASAGEKDRILSTFNFSIEFPFLWYHF